MIKWKSETTNPKIRQDFQCDFFIHVSKQVGLIICYTRVQMYRLLLDLLYLFEFMCYIIIYIISVYIFGTFWIKYACIMVRVT